MAASDSIWNALFKWEAAEKGNAVSKCPAAGQGLKLNARQSETFTEFLLKDSFKLLNGI